MSISKVCLNLNNNIQYAKDQLRSAINDFHKTTPSLFLIPEKKKIKEASTLPCTKLPYGHCKEWPKPPKLPMCTYMPWAKVRDSVRGTIRRMVVDGDIVIGKVEK